MLRRTLNLGILAHVDAGKTTLTERLLYGAGVIDAVGRVDDGTTQTDTLALERQRGITIKAAVVAFSLGDVKVNLIDTPGHPDFIAEVERVLSVLDGAVLVLSAVEGVQPQTRVLMRALQRLRIPTLLFLNKIDRAGADDARVLRAIAERLTPAVVAMGSTYELGTRSAGFVPSGAGDAAFRERLAETLAEHDERVLAAYLEEGGIAYEALRLALARQTRQALVHPVYCGSAATGAGVDALAAGIAELLPAGDGDAGAAPAASVFKIESHPGGEKVAYVRMLAGTLRTRQRVRVGDEEAKVTALEVFEHGRATQAQLVCAGEIARVRGLTHARIGDRIGDASTPAARQFAPPPLEAVVVPRDPDDATRLRAALAELAEQDPLVDVRQADGGRQVSVSLYGEVQKEVIEATLRDDYGLEVEFGETTTIHVERPAGTGEAAEELNAEGNPFHAGIALRVEPAPLGCGVDFRLAVDVGSVPLYAYRTLPRFADAMAQYVRDALRAGLYGWEVVDCVVTMTGCAYSSADGPPSARGPLSKPADYRDLTPLVLLRALAKAGTVVCEPLARARVELPAGVVGPVLGALARLDAAAQPPELRGGLAIVEAVLPAARVQELRRRLPALTGGEGVVESDPAGDRPVAGEPPTRPRTAPSPLDRAAYLARLTRGAGPR